MKSIAKDIAERPNAWFVGIAPRRNPDIVVVVLWQHGGWGAGSARLAAQIIESYVTKQRRLQNNLQIAETPGPVDVGALWSEPADGQKDGGSKTEESTSKPEVAANSAPLPPLHAGHFMLSIPSATAARRAQGPSPSAESAPLKRAAD
jgi:penicillin-binding protein 2